MSNNTEALIASEIADFFAGFVEIHTELGGPNTVEEAQQQLTDRVTRIASECEAALIAALEQSRQRVEDEICRANREHHRGFMMACRHLEEHANVHYADAAEVEIAALRNRIAELEASPSAVKLPAANFKKLAEEIVDNLVDCGGADDSDIRQYLEWTERTCRAAFGQVEGE